MALGSKAWAALMRRNGLYLRRYWLSTILELVLPITFLLMLVGIRSLVPEVEGDLISREIPTQAFTPLRFMDYVTALKAKRECVSNTSLKDFLTSLAETFGVPLDQGFDIPEDATLEDFPAIYMNQTGQPIPPELQDFIDHPELYGIPKSQTFRISGYADSEWYVPLLKCDPVHCTSAKQDATDFCERHMVGVAGAAAKAFIDWVHAEYPDSEQFGIFQEFADARAMDQYVEGKDYGRGGTQQKMAMGIVFASNSTNEWNYHLRPNSTNINFPLGEGNRPAAPTTPDTGRITDDFARTDSACTLEGADGSSSCAYQYAFNGVLTFQRLVHDFIGNVTGASETHPVGATDFVPFPSREYIGAGFFSYISTFLTIVLSLGLLYPVASMISYMTKEKEYRQKELLKMMSVTESDIGWSWFVTFFLFHLVTATLCGIISTKLFTKSSFLLLWLFWLYTMIGTIVFCMVISSLTSKSTRAVLIGLLIFFSGAFLTLAQPYDTGNKSAVQAISLHPIAAFSYGIKQIGDLEEDSVGLVASTVSLSDNRNGYSFRDTLAILLVDSVVWGFLAWYLNRVIPPDYGQALPIWFPFMPSYWCSTNKPSKAPEEMADDVAARNASIPYEPVGDLKRQVAEGKSIEINNLRKSFGDKLAVDDLNLSIFSGQITALLGHNGAGKTTTISILTGALAPTEGDATIFGKSIRSDLSSIRKDIGICLQHDCLFPDLTVREHIQFFARLKGLYDSVPRREAEELINQSIRDVALYEKRNTRSKALSGGMKRKLSVCMAFCGGSRVVLLDEPTSGMDPFSRRFTWNVIRQYRQGRCIILTTHFMDEADILGDRIAIMSEGQLRCAGSPLFLKKTYGVGYQLTVERNVVNAKHLDNGALTIRDSEIMTDVTDEDDISGKFGGNGLEKHAIVDTLAQTIKKQIPEASVLSSVGTELKFQIPLGASSKFSTLFQMLDGQVDNMNVVSYGISMTTLDEVFLLVARGDSVGKTEVVQSSRRLLDENNIELRKGNLFLVHLAALFKKRASIFRRDKKAWLCTTVLPSLFVMIGFLVYRNSGRARSLPALTLDLSALNSGISGDFVNPIHFNEGEYTCLPGRCVHDEVYDIAQTKELYSFCGGLKITDVKCLVSDESSLIMNSLDNFEGSDLIPSASSDVEESSEELLAFSSSYTSSQYGSIWISRVPGSATTNGSVFDETLVAECQANANSSRYISERDCNRLRGMGFLIQYNFTGLHTAPLFQSLADQALIRYATNNPDFVIKTTISPLPTTNQEDGFGGAEDSFLAWFLVVLSFPFICGAYAAFVVQEREIKAKHLQTVAGVDPSAYWISTFLWDSLNYQFPLWTTVALMFLFKVKVLTTSDNDIFLGVLALLFFYGPAAAGFSYVVSFAFKSPTFCNVLIIIVGFIVSFAGSLATLIMNLLIAVDLGGRKLSLASNIVNWSLRFFPPFNLAKGLLYVLYLNTFALIEQDPDISAFHKDVLLLEVIFLAAEGIVYTAIAILFDVYLNRPSVTGVFGRALFKNTAVAALVDEDSDVLAEEERVNSGAAADDMIVIKKMSKVYGNGKIAVNSMSLGIHTGECFGLLGINGAGKTTAMGMLTAEFPPSSGDATLAGFSIVREPQRIRRKIGYCPQFDAHFSNMTGREHVELYAAVKGIPRHQVSDAARAKLADVGLSEKDSDRLCSNYSGGMKRRLSLACATIGKPSVVFLDECSTGVDPVARREIWQMISDMVAVDENGVSNTSVILTTHSMEECEALCPRIGIMANGRLRCLGSAQHLKNKFGQGYQIELKAKVIEGTDDDFIHIARSLASFKGTLFAEQTAVADVNLTFSFAETIGALNHVTNDMFLSSMISETHAQGFNVYRDATSVAGISLLALATFCTSELRIRNLGAFVMNEFPNNVMRERQDLKIRYEVSNDGLRISEIFSKIEERKEQLLLADYGVSQTSLEQVFNRHAAEAEGFKVGTNDH